MNTYMATLDDRQRCLATFREWAGERDWNWDDKRQAIYEAMLDGWIAAWIRRGNLNKKAITS